MLEEEKGAKEKKEVTREEFDSMISAVSKLVESSKVSTESINELSKNLKGVTETINSDIKLRKDSQIEDKDKKLLQDKVDLESMSRADLADHIASTTIDAIKDILEEDIKSVKKGVEDVDAKVVEREMKAQLDAVMEKHPDFMEWKNEVGAKVTANPNLPLEEAYALVRAADKDKSEEMDKKFNLEGGLLKESGGKDNSGGEGSITEENTENRKFFGLTPTSGVTKKSSEMTRDDAVNAAWESTMGALENTLTGEQV